MIEILLWVWAVVMFIGQIAMVVAFFGMAANLRKIRDQSARQIDLQRLQVEQGEAMVSALNAIRPQFRRFNCPHCRAIIAEQTLAQGENNCPECGGSFAYGEKAA